LIDQTSQINRSDIKDVDDEFLCEKNEDNLTTREIVLNVVPTILGLIIGFA